MPSTEFDFRRIAIACNTVRRDANRDAAPSGACANVSTTRPGPIDTTTRLPTSNPALLIHMPRSSSEGTHSSSPFAPDRQSYSARIFRLTGPIQCNACPADTPVDATTPETCICHLQRKMSLARMARESGG